MAKAELENAAAIISTASLKLMQLDDQKAVDIGLQIHPLTDDIEKAIKGYGFVLRKLKGQCHRATAILKTLSNSNPAVRYKCNEAIAAMWGNRS